jgi:hypothetical protein
MYGPGSIYAITPTTQEIATAFVRRNVGAPIQPYQLKMLPKPGEVQEDPEGEETWQSSADDEPDF